MRTFNFLLSASIVMLFSCCTSQPENTASEGLSSSDADGIALTCKSDGESFKIKKKAD